MSATRHVVRHVAVVIPARNEVETIGATVDAVDDARRRLPPGVTSSLTIVVDASEDGTATVIERRRRRGGPTSPPGAVVVHTARGCVGAARARGCRVALAGALHTSSRVWLANTDADTLVPPDWLTAQLALSADGVEAIAGIVELGPDADDGLRSRFAASYELRPDGTHPHVHGANLGVRGDAYLAAGGWSTMSSGEDHDLWARLRQAAICVSSAAIRVRTSARTTARAPDGFARDLARLGATTTRRPATEPTVA